LFRHAVYGVGNIAAMLIFATGAFFRYLSPAIGYHASAAFRLLPARHYATPCACRRAAGRCCCMPRQADYADITPPLYFMLSIFA